MYKPVILIVESEALIRMSAVHMVEDAGFAALEASNADEAIALLEVRRDIRAVFTDVRMSGSMDGVKLARAIKGRWPPIHLLITSGSNAPEQGELPPNGRFIAKPYRPEEVVALLCDMLGYPAPRPFLNDKTDKCDKVA
jgi:CheY-like chemotaxis protein